MNQWMAVSLAVFKDGTIYGYVEFKGSQAQVQAYVDREVLRTGTRLDLPPHLKNRKPSLYMLYGLEIDGGTDFRVVIPDNETRKN